MGGSNGEAAAPWDCGVPSRPVPLGKEGGAAQRRGGSTRLTDSAPGAQTRLLLLGAAPRPRPEPLRLRDRRGGVKRRQGSGRPARARPRRLPPGSRRAVACPPSWPPWCRPPPRRFVVLPHGITVATGAAGAAKQERRQAYPCQGSSLGSMRAPYVLLIYIIT